MDIYRRNVWFCVAVHVVWFVYLIGEVTYIVYLFIHTCMQGHELTDKDNRTIAFVLIPGLVVNLACTILSTIGSNNDRERRIKQYEIPYTREANIEENNDASANKLDIVIGATQPKCAKEKQQFVVIVNP